MRRRIVIALLALGTIGGYGAGIAHAVHMHHARCAAHGEPTHCAGWHDDDERH